MSKKAFIFEYIAPGHQRTYINGLLTRLTYNSRSTEPPQSLIEKFNDLRRRKAESKPDDYQ